jgi:hypothetical protein
MAVSDAILVKNANLRLVNPNTPDSKLAEIKYYFDIVNQASDATSLKLPATSVAATQLSAAVASTSTGKKAQTPKALMDQYAILRVIVGACTASATMKIEGSPDGTTFTKIYYALSATPTTWTNADITYATPTTTYVYVIKPGQAISGALVQYVRANFTAVTTTTITSVDLFYLGGTVALT